MYEEKEVTYKVGINWKDIIIKVILLILFILLLVWLFPNQIWKYYIIMFIQIISTL